jgi:hypothetical protein
MNLKNIIDEISNSELRCELDIINIDIEVIRCNLNTEDDVDIFLLYSKKKVPLIGLFKDN